MIQGRLTKQLEDLINQLLELPEEAFTDSTVDVIIGMLRGSITEQVREEIIQAQLQEYRESNFNKKLARENLDDFKADVAGIKTDFEAEWSKNKLKALSAILDIMVELAEASCDRLENFDIELPFQLLHPDAQIPTYAHDTDAGADVYLIEDVVIPAFSIGKIIKTGLAMALPVGWEMQIRPRSGLSHKTAMRIANSPGTIDTSYRGEVGIIVDNFSEEPITLNKGDRIAQFVLAPSYKFKPQMVKDVKEIGEDRNGGFGSTD